MKAVYDWSGARATSDATSRVWLLVLQVLEDPVISVVMPVRHGAEYLVAGAQSLFRQTLHDFELVVIDDGADAACKTNIAAIAAMDGRTRVHACAGRGIADALNQGLSLARAPFVARMDADDISQPTRLARLRDAMVAKPSAAVIGSNYRIIDKDGRRGREVILPAAPSAIRTELKLRNPICHPATMMRKEAVLAAGGYRRALIGCEDFDLWIRISERHDLENLQETLLLYRQHDQQTTWEQLEQRLCSEVAIFASARARAAGGKDLPLLDRPASSEMLVACGMTGGTLRQEMRVRAMEAATHAINAGERRQAAAALKIALRHGAASSTDTVAYWKLRAKIALSTLRAPLNASSERATS